MIEAFARDRLSHCYDTKFDSLAQRKPADVSLVRAEDLLGYPCVNLAAIFECFCFVLATQVCGKPSTNI